MHLVAGLGNPGAAHRKNRHNVGFMVVDRIARQVNRRWRRSLAYSQVCWVRRASQRVLLAKPQTSMNLSGQALAELLDYCPFELSRVLLVYDDIALPLGRIRIRHSGSAGGQKGMQSVIAALGTENIRRLRVGIGQDMLPADYTQYVLGDFGKEEEAVLDRVLERAIEATYFIMDQGIDRAMSVYN